ncbi:hypothetical protein LJ655_03430 [Paraburkholderia sp. MMS20-SJTN17]|uniref:DNA-binding protein n=1 Tax=Paraburkholderia translucens TaxID=2886945 RepID=A0ABS8K8G0_9BURK|nr:hypothetical protein [Paraburkholderia sp. MMS20-SJTN17]MCC8400952.1 hypothetical protein [Paraburkholderia sp. MMS20-SJTN17]
MRDRDAMTDEAAATLLAWLVAAGFDYDPVYGECCEKATARAMRVAPSTLSRWYWEGSGPIRPARILNGRRWYSLDTIVQWLVDGAMEAAD